ncbi:exosortase system-associated protein, TIGR04073 family [Geomonas sp.]|uniref:exosortase system-associated protein, TIGR04073 family n=1 Tax=Geomonas sp. TaxID=2651584 RepID=UPI002B4A01ED|nr:exosortase system-associated protein, TIGR04073 family [Geomonas sp.]HJV35676.1 exosortase system-associated protein, TIGR04073 family [Geomonas sp.]
MSKRFVMQTLLVLAVCLCLTPGRARAQSDTLDIDDASAQEIVGGMSNKFARGVTNIGTGWLEFPKQIYTTTQEEGVTKGVLLGPIKGIGMTVARTLAGVGDAALFFVSYPGFFSPLIDPPFVWEKE